MTVSKVLLSAVVALALVPAVAQAAAASAPARALSISPAASSLSLAEPVRVGARGGKKSHAFIALLGLPALLGLGVVTAVAVTAAAGGFSGNSSGG